jgi:LacI family transcriptional regulator
MKARPYRHVLVALSWYYPALHRGIARYARDHRWHLTADLDEPVPEHWRGDGVLTLLGSRRRPWESLQTFRVPIVDLTESRPEIPLPRVTVDNTAVGMLAARHFLDRGYRHFAMVHRWEGGVSRKRRAAFSDPIRKAGCTCDILSWERDYGEPAANRAFRHRTLMPWLVRLPKPLAVFASRDDEAAEVLEACLAARIPVPEQVAVLGVDNTDTICDCLCVPLSSVDSNLEQVGYEGAALLDRIMSHRAVAEKHIEVAPAGIVERRSTDAYAVEQPRVRQALQFIQENCQLPIGVPDIARAVGLSRSGLEKVFRDAFVRSPGQQLRRIRLERAKKMLAESDAAIAAVGAATGFQSSHHFCRAFREQWGMSPGQYRRQLRIAATPLARASR